MKHIILSPRVGSFAENKDIARDIRLSEILPALAANEDVTIDFEGIHDATQSFIHALLSDVLRQYGDEVLDRLRFRSCSETVRKMIEIVVEYMQESEG